jgi:hypothetical protein
MLQWSASFHTRNNNGRPDMIIAQTEGQGALSYGIDALIKMQAYDDVIRLQAWFGVMMHLSSNQMDSWESMSLQQIQAILGTYPRS